MQIVVEVTPELVELVKKRQELLSAEPATVNAAQWNKEYAQSNFDLANAFAWEIKKAIGEA